MRSIGLRIAKLREERGLSQKQLAEELGKIGLSVRRETVTQWENGTRDLKTEYTVKLADFFGVTCDFILRGIAAENVSISEATGLSEDAIMRLKKIINIPLPHGLGNHALAQALNDFIGAECFPSLMISFMTCCRSITEYQRQRKIFRDTVGFDMPEKTNISIDIFSQYAPSLYASPHTQPEVFGTEFRDITKTLATCKERMRFNSYRVTQLLNCLIDEYKKEQEKAWLTSKNAGTNPEN